MKILTSVFVLLLFALPLAAQDTVVVGTPITLEWDQPAATLAQAQSYTYFLYIAGAGDTLLSGVTCTGTGTLFVCRAPLFALAVGTYGFELVARNPLESLKSSPVWTLTVVSAPTPPAAPRGLRRGQQ